jgi:two-component system LytT family response regulator
MDASALIAEDEPLLASELEQELKAAWPALRVVGRAEHGAAAVELALRNRPDVLFLDIRMPGLSGFEAAEAIAEDWPDGVPAPLVVFVTAYDAHALAAFDLNAVDYLLKPYDEERFRRALDRVRGRFLSPEKRGSAVRMAREQTGVSDRLLVPVGDGLRLIDCVSIHSLEADDNYVHVHAAGQRYVLRRTLRDLLLQLGEQRFVRIHKSVAVNIAEIDTLAPLFKGDYELRLRSGRVLRLSRRYTAELFHRTGR